ncbi:hypothetical protein [Nocardiopsis sp. MG754419]|uniref:hypothetical protein n=1 Tax=Nocardiopsis sp. MG754419 TaxID=2259865 RepID=UPI001BA60389|nr:hypothetical protein [Nocardiopsis sp. MG754419]MBR8741676.1 hypothetical protein [Nocardiopsis sp. MG754419]
MIIWRGWGILVPLIAAVIAVPCAALTAEVTGQQHLGGLGAGVGLLLASVAVFLAGNRLNTPRRGFHPATGRPVEYRNTHTFFFVPMQYWAFVLPLAAFGAAATAFPL